MKRSQPAVTSERVNQILTLVPYLAERGEVSVATAAADFGVKEAQMRAMVQKLTLLGLPGDDGYWQPSEGLFDIDWDLLEDHDRISLTHTPALQRAPRLTAREAAALLAGLRLVSAHPDLASSAVIPTLIEKLSRGAASAPADVVVASAPIDSARQLLADAVRDNVAVAFRYQAPDATPTTRTVSPSAVVLSNGQWYLRGWCHLRRAERTFLLDRMSDIELTDITVTPPADEAVPNVAADSSVTEVQVRLSAAAAPFLRGMSGGEASEDAEGNVLLTLRVGDISAIKRVATRFGGAMEVLSPPAARHLVHEWAARARELYDVPAAPAEVDKLT